MNALFGRDIALISTTESLLKLFLAKRLTRNKTLLRLNRIGIDAKEDVTKFGTIETTLDLIQPMLSIFRKLLNILRSIKFRILITMIYKVISDVVSLPKLIAGDDPLVNSVSDGLITVILVAMRSQLDLVRSYRQTEVEMHVTLLLADTHNNTVHILGARLDIFLSPGNQDLTSLADIAWLIFIRDAERNDVQLGKILFERFRAAHIQHLQQALLRSVDSVFCAALPVPTR